MATRSHFDHFQIVFEFRKIKRYGFLTGSIKNYTGIVLTNLSENITLGDTDITVDDGSKIPAVSSTENLYLDIGGEEVLVVSKEGNQLIIKRGQDSTTAVSHIKGTAVKSITTADNASIEVGDDFGFDGTTESWL